MMQPSQPECQFMASETPEEDFGNKSELSFLLTLCIWDICEKTCQGVWTSWMECPQKNEVFPFTPSIHCASHDVQKAAIIHTTQNQA